jgi:hypothetical protein
MPLGGFYREAPGLFKHECTVAVYSCLKRLPGVPCGLPVTYLPEHVRHGRSSSSGRPTVFAPPDPGAHPLLYGTARVSMMPVEV